MWQWVSDSYHFARQMGSQLFGDNSYTASAFSQPLSKNPEERKKQGAEANRYAAATKVIARETETATALVMTAPEYITSGIGFKSAGNLVGRAIGLADIGSGTLTEDIANHILAQRGEAPLQTIHARIVPHNWTFVGGDKHYQTGGTPDDHPDRPKVTGPIETGIVKPREFGNVAKSVIDFVAPPASSIPSEIASSPLSVATSTTSTAPLPGHSISSPNNQNKGRVFGIGSFILPIILLGIAALTGPVGWGLGAILIGIGAVAGSPKVLGMITGSNQQPSQNVASTAQPSSSTLPAPAAVSEPKVQVPPVPSTKTPDLSVPR